MDYNNNQLIPVSRNFVNAKNEIQEFSKKKPEDINLPKVDTEGKYFGCFGTSHTVEGHELNTVTSKMQHYLIQINSLQTDFIDEFGKVYEAFEALDKDYIAAFKANILAIRENAHDIKIAQESIQKTVDRLEKTILKLKSISEETNERIEKIKRAVINLDDNLGTLEGELSLFKDDYELQITNIKQMQNDIRNSISVFEYKLSQYSRLDEFDEQLGLCIDNNEALKKDNERLGKQILDLQNTLLQEQRDHSQKLQGLNDMLTAKIKNAYLIGGAGVMLSIVLAGFLFTK